MCEMEQPLPRRAILAKHSTAQARHRTAIMKHGNQTYSLRLPLLIPVERQGNAEGKERERKEKRKKRKKNDQCRYSVRQKRPVRE